MVHPHPAMGGDRHHPLVVAVADGLAAAGVAALRLDLDDPDVTTSARCPRDGGTELAADVGVERLFLVGYSWGSVVSSLAAPVGLPPACSSRPPVAGFAFAAQRRPARARPRPRPRPVRRPGRRRRGHGRLAAHHDRDG